MTYKHTISSSWERDENPSSNPLHAHGQIVVLNEKLLGFICKESFGIWVCLFQKPDPSNRIQNMECIRKNRQQEQKKEEYRA